VNKFNEDVAFSLIWKTMQSGELKTAHQLRLILDDLAGKSNLSTLAILHSFRIWLLNHDIDLSTEHGAVTYSIITPERRSELLAIEMARKANIKQ
jgi:hypothetical protein